MRPSLKAFLLFAGIGIGVYYNALDNPFHFDDLHSIEHNPHIRSLQNLPDFFTDLHTFSSERRGTMFRPLLLTSYAFNYWLHGAAVQGYRWVNLLLHVLCSTLVFCLLRRLGGPARVAWVGGALFLLHPTHAEVVNYISSRSDLLVSFFYLAALLLAFKERERIVPGTHFAYIAGLLSKSVAFTLPLIVGGYRVWRWGWRQFWQNGSGYLILGGISAAYLGVLVANRFLDSSIAKAPRGLEVQIWTQLKAFVYYLFIFAMPVDLSVEPQFFVAQSLWAPAPLLAALLLVSMGFWAYQSRRRLPLLGWVFFLVALLPASLFPLNLLVGERRMYLASAGLILVLAWAWEPLLRRLRLGGVIGVAALGLIFAISCVQRNQVWASKIGLWEDAVRQGPRMFRPRANLALAYVKQGRREEALAELQVALEIKPDFADAWVEVGNIRKEQGAMEAAKEAYEKALIFDADLEGVYYNLGNIYQESGRPAAAIAYYGQALERNPNFADAHNNLGQALEASGRPDEALARYQQALDIDPDQPQAWYNLAVLSEKKEQFEKARKAYEKAHQLLVDDPEYAGNPLYQKFARRALDGFLRLK